MHWFHLTIICSLACLTCRSSEVFGLSFWGTNPKRYWVQHDIDNNVDLNTSQVWSMYVNVTICIALHSKTAPLWWVFKSFILKYWKYSFRSMKLNLLQTKKHQEGVGFLHFWMQFVRSLSSISTWKTLNLASSFSTSGTELKGHIFS